MTYFRRNFPRKSLNFVKLSAYHFHVCFASPFHDFLYSDHPETDHHKRNSSESNLSYGVQQLAVGVQDDAERQHQAEGEQADDVGDVVRRLGPPVDRARGAGTLGAVPAPAQQRRCGPGQGVEPGEADAPQRRAVVCAVGHGGRHHGAVTLVGQHGEGNQGDDA